MSDRSRKGSPRSEQRDWTQFQSRIDEVLSEFRKHAGSDASSSEPVARTRPTLRPIALPPFKVKVGGSNPVREQIMATLVDVLAACRRSRTN